MPFQSPITVAKALERIHRHEYVLPAIQREFVWGTDQICMLFDSLMRGYPFGSFLFWKVDRENCRKYVFYDFMREYHEKDRPHCEVLDLQTENAVVAILDGQQRLTALSIGLRGSHAEKLPYKRIKNSAAYPIRFLYLDLRAEAVENEQRLRYKFKFLTEEKTKEENGPNCHWFRVSRIWNMKDGPEIFDYVRDNGLANHPTAYRTLHRLSEMVHRDNLISFFEEEEQDLDKVLNIFIRVNSAGTVLSYADLLLSIATAQWKGHGRDARREVYGLVDELNATRFRFDFPKDLVLKAALVLADIPDVAFKVTNFNATNMATIESKWSHIASALRLAVQLFASFGFSEKTLTANNVVIPIAYYLMMRGATPTYLTSRPEVNDREVLRRWIIRALLKPGIWGSGLDTLLRSLREVLKKDSAHGFPAVALENAMKPMGKSLRFDESELEALLESEYGHRGTFALLSLLYPGNDLRNEFHEDHIFPKSLFSRRALESAGVTSEQVEDYREKRHQLPNLQLLEGSFNIQKSDQLPTEWIKAHFRDSASSAAYIAKHDLGDVPTELQKFVEFFAARRERIANKLRALLDVQPSVPPPSTPPPPP